MWIDTAQEKDEDEQRTANTKKTHTEHWASKSCFSYCNQLNWYHVKTLPLWEWSERCYNTAIALRSRISRLKEEKQEEYSRRLISVDSENSCLVKSIAKKTRQSPYNSIWHVILFFSTVAVAVVVVVVIVINVRMLQFNTIWFGSFVSSI